MVGDSTSIGALVPTAKTELADSSAEAPPAPAPPSEAPEKEPDVEEVDKDVLCPICMQIIKDAFLTACGHSFCYMCIVTHLQNKSDCPCCSHFLTTNHLYPNFLLNKLLRKTSARQIAKTATPLEQLHQALEEGCEASPKELQSLLYLIAEKKSKVEQKEAETNLQILLDFLLFLKKKKLDELNEIQSDLRYIKEDIHAVEVRRMELYRRRERYSAKMRMPVDDPTSKSVWPSLMDKHSGAAVTRTAIAPGQGRMSSVGFRTEKLIIEFDRDDELFATAGVSRRIKIFEFSSVLNEATDVQCPVSEMFTRSKLSCLSWNKYIKNHIASSDYEGIVTVWDVTTRQVGSADHHIHYYDLRKTNQPLHIFSGHRKAVSYVKFLSNNELASASTDSTLRLWDVKENVPLRIFRGHANEKNFVGLTVNSEYIACGSETNEAISKPAACHRFISSDTDEAGEDASSYFISAVCWKSDSPTMLTANSQGTIKEKKSGASQNQVTSGDSNPAPVVNGGVNLDSSVFLKKAHELKEEGNRRFQAKDYVGALQQYENALKLTPKTHPDRAVFHSNRAACLMQMKPIDYETVISECNLALQVQPRFVRALLRRARALRQ
ncbi:hypothetical protein DH2020_033053 [Rehmannia glutinosa]|uniref:RING-type domain-containing protein n=1 Tax=Rehmannia glutinosa TaxID=99300 RepID=A0ABR0VDF5_REHGL